MEDLAVFTALNHSGSFGKNLVKFKKNKYVIYRLRVGPYGEKLSTSVLKMLPSAYDLGQYFQDTKIVSLDWSPCTLLQLFCNAYIRLHQPSGVSTGRDKDKRFRTVDNSQMDS